MCMHSCPLNHLYAVKFFELQVCLLVNVCAVMSCDLSHMYAMHMSTSDVTLEQYRHIWVGNMLNRVSVWRVLG